SAHKSRMAGKERSRTNAGVKVAAAPNHDAIVRKSKPQAAKGNFKTCCRFIVAGEQICYAHRVWVEGAPQRDAELPKSGASQILNTRQKTSTNSGRIHIVDLSNSSRVMERKRRRSPARKRAGGSFWGSHQRSGVRPMTFQPPGDLSG